MPKYIKPIEKKCLLDYNNAEYLASYGLVSQLPKSTKPEVAFVGRSNVGKSSLINALLGRKALAKVSSTPGKTSTINFFEVDKCHFVDLPGYGYAKVSKKELTRWAELIEGYFTDERKIAIAVSLIDVRHSPTSQDRLMISYLKEMRLPFAVVFTKADKLSKQRAMRNRKAISDELGVPTATPSLLTSADVGTGIYSLRTKIGDYVEVALHKRKKYKRR